MMTCRTYADGPFEITTFRDVFVRQHVMVRVVNWLLGLFFKPGNVVVCSGRNNGADGLIEA